MAIPNFIHDTNEKLDEFEWIFLGGVPIDQALRRAGISSLGAAWQLYAKHKRPTPPQVRYEYDLFQGSRRIYS